MNCSSPVNCCRSRRGHPITKRRKIIWINFEEDVFDVLRYSVQCSCSHTPNPKKERKATLADVVMLNICLVHYISSQHSLTAWLFWLSFVSVIKWCFASKLIFNLLNTSDCLILLLPSFSFSSSLFPIFISPWLFQSHLRRTSRQPY